MASSFEDVTEEFCVESVECLEDELSTSDTPSTLIVINQCETLKQLTDTYMDSTAM